jgi:hypothetical protein
MIQLKTALMQACRSGHWEVVQTLLAFRCNVRSSAEEPWNQSFAILLFLLIIEREFVSDFFRVWLN